MLELTLAQSLLWVHFTSSHAHFHTATNYRVAWIPICNYQAAWSCQKIGLIPFMSFRSLESKYLMRSYCHSLWNEHTHHASRLLRLLHNKNHSFSRVQIVSILQCQFFHYCNNLLTTTYSIICSMNLWSKCITAWDWGIVNMYAKRYFQSTINVLYSGCGGAFIHGGSSELIITAQLMSDACACV